MIVSIVLAMADRKRDVYPNDTTQIMLYGEAHGFREYYDIEFECWQELYGKGCRDLFVELPYYSAEFLNIWMYEDNDELIDQFFEEIQGTQSAVDEYNDFFHEIKSECPGTVFHGTDVGHQNDTTGKRYLRYLEENGLTDSEEYAKALECMRQGDEFHANDDTHTGMSPIRESYMVSNFIRDYTGGTVMGIYGSYHTDLNNPDLMAGQLRSHYGDVMSSVRLSTLAFNKNSNPYRLGICISGLIMLIMLFTPNIIWARSAKQTRQVLDDLKAGRIDILIGTHKILGKGVEWKDLGLLIIDEEQKFGVSTKEKLRRIKTNVDTLTMSATPIPRTLQFSLMGARDMSIIRTPPPNRLPVYTELTTFSRELIADAINFEMSRNGQVYFVSSRISNLTEIEHLIRKYVPDARVAVAHGQMKPEELEKIVMGFINYDYDVLLSTTIVENGIDIPNANTIIINDAQRFGLSDLHQMRGRVGRSNRKAFCYLLAPPKAVLPPPARQRLEALENFSEMGSGFNLAMQDLDIRGAGNLLGAEQSGFMEDLGYDTYQRILNQAVTELKNTEFGDLFEQEMKEGRKITGADFVEDCMVETDMEMCFPDRYVPGSSERMLLYRELDNITNERDLDAYRKRLEDRFGPVPREGLELMQVVSLRRLGRHLGCVRIVLKKGYMQMYLVTQDNSPFYRSQLFDNMIEYVTKFHRRCQFNPTPGKRALTVSDVKTVGEAVFVLRQMENGQFSAKP